MIHLELDIQAPFYKYPLLCNIWWKAGYLSKHKWWEIEVIKINSIFCFKFSLDFKGHDHAGLKFELALLGYSLNISIYDCRHWDHKANSWKEDR